MRVGHALPFEAVAYAPNGLDPATRVQWQWDFGDGASSGRNPATHTFTTAGTYQVCASATAREGAGSAAVTVEVTGSLLKPMANSGLYLRDPQTKATVADDGVCDVLEIVLDVTGEILLGYPTLYRQNSSGVYDSFGTMNPDPTAPPGTARFVHSWMTWDTRASATFKAIYLRMPMSFPPIPIPVVVGPKTWTPQNTKVTSSTGDLAFDGTNPVTIDWDIAHADRNSPTFAVTIKIYGIGAEATDQPIREITLTGQPRGAGSATWTGEINGGMPGYPPMAQAGVYKFIILAVHTTVPMCEDRDKDLTDSEVDGTIIGDEDPSGMVTGRVMYWLARQASSCYIDIWGHQLGAYPVLLVGGVGCPDLGGGSHLSDEFTIPAIGFPITPIVHPIYPDPPGSGTPGDPGFGDGGGPTWEFHADVTIAGVDEDHEDDPGALVWYNRDDDNGNGIEDCSSAEESGVTGEDDLVSIILTAHTDAPVSSMTATLTWTGDGQRVAVWETPTKTGRVAAMPPPTYGITNHTWMTMLYLEGVSPSSVKAQDHFTLSVNASLTAPAGGGAVLLAAADNAGEATWAARVELVDFHSQSTVDDQGQPNGRQANLVPLYANSTAYDGWDPGEALTGAEWQRDGNDEDLLPDRDQPAAYLRHHYVRPEDADWSGHESHAAATVTIQRWPAGLRMSASATTGVGGGGMEFASVSYVDLEGQLCKVEVEAPLPVAIGRYSLSCQWSIVPDEGGGLPKAVHEATEHTLYVVFGPVDEAVEDPGGPNFANPLTPRRLDFALDTLGAAGATDLKDLSMRIASGIGAQFAGQFYTFEELDEKLVEGDIAGHPWRFWAVAWPPGNGPYLSCHQQALLAVHALDVLGVQGWVHKVHATTNLVDQLAALQPPAQPCTSILNEQPLRAVNNYVSDYDPMDPYLMCCHSDAGACRLHGATYPHLLVFHLNLFEGCFRVPVIPPQDDPAPGAAWDPDGDGNMWFTTVPAQYHDDARALLTWYAAMSSQVWREWVVVEPREKSHFGDRDAQTDVPLPPAEQLDLLPDILK